MQKDQGKLPALDGLRALAILLVLFCHIALQASGRHLIGPSFLNTLGVFGFTGVFLFFVLSGFLLFLPYARALLGGSSWPSVRYFYLRRALRILPVFLVVLLLLLLLYVGLIRYPATPQALALTPILFYDILPASTTLVNVMNPPFWTLAIEWQFYLLLPWIALGLAWFGGRRAGKPLFWRLALGLGLLIVASLAIRVLAAIAHYTSGQDNPVAAPGMLGVLMALLFGARGKQLDVFALGMATSLLYVWAKEQGNLSLARQRWLSQIALLLSVIGLIASFWWASLVDRVPDLYSVYFPKGQVWAVFGEWTLGICFMFLLIAVLFSKAWLNTCFSLRPLRFIGIISYSLYAWHFPLLLFCVLAVPQTPDAFGSFVLLACVVIFPVGTVSYYLIERPFLRWRRAPRFSQKPPIEPQVASQVQLL